MTRNNEDEIFFAGSRALPTSVSSYEVGQGFIYLDLVLRLKSARHHARRRATESRSVSARQKHSQTVADDIKLSINSTEEVLKKKSAVFNVVELKAALTKNVKTAFEAHRLSPAHILKKVYLKHHV